MALPTVFARLRSEPQLSRVQDQISTTLNPVAQALASTPIMGAAPPAWIRPSPLLADFVEVAARQPGYHVDALNYAHGRGAVSSAAGQAAGTTIFVLPMGVRPGQDVRLAVRSSAGAATIAILADGTVFPEQNVAAGGSIDLNFYFLVEQ